jgi:hypothetical protein
LYAQADRAAKEELRNLQREFTRNLALFEISMEALSVLDAGTVPRRQEYIDGMDAEEGDWIEESVKRPEKGKSKAQQKQKAGAPGFVHKTRSCRIRYITNSKGTFKLRHYCGRKLHLWASTLDEDPGEDWRLYNAEEDRVRLSDFKAAVESVASYGTREIAGMAEGRGWKAVDVLPEARALRSRLELAAKELKALHTASAADVKMRLKAKARGCSVCCGGTKSESGELLGTTGKAFVPGVQQCSACRAFECSPVLCLDCSKGTEIVSNFLCPECARVVKQ